MSEDDPHVHVDAKLHAHASARIVLADTFGLVAELPTVADTGCGRRVPYAMTSSRPASVTCLACRQFAAEEHGRAADQALRLARMPGIGVPVEQLTQAAAHHREQAARYLDLP
ncbi:hypothetical protein [Cryptosporangium minutisporangium]|uniref:Uncharacterized protein n=1 Tax=Cryptosporangium minutisporangium TaxID=113569 RepID=A0ABP6SZP9_9ACTN